MSTAHRLIPVEQWKDPRQVLGVWGERLAVAYLAAREWNIEAHRFRLGRHDIDVVARSGRIVAFVEVKTRRTSTFGSGLEAVGSRKRQILAKVAAAWRVRCGRPGDIYRFDVIVIQRQVHGYEIDHLEDAWRCDG